MSVYQKIICVFIAVVFSVPVDALELSVKDVEQVAIQNDPLIFKYQAKAQAYMEDSIAEAQWPDPRLKFGFINVPITSFNLTQEPMTQTVIGLQQVIPRGAVLSYKKEKKRLIAEVERAKAVSHALHILRKTRKSWMDVYYFEQALLLVKESEDVFTQLVKITRYQYRAGRGKQQNVIAAQLEKSLLKDKETFFLQEKKANLAKLEKWVGASLEKHTLSSTFPELPNVPPFKELNENLEFHPSLAIEKAKLGATRKNVAIAKENFKPKWMVDISYGLRLGENIMPDGSLVNRADFFTAKVSVDLPFFTEKRQDRRLNARGYELNAASDSIESRKRELKEILDVAYTNWVQLGLRLDFFETSVLPQASQYADASRKAYQSHVSDFSDLVRARLRKLDSDLLALKIRVDRMKAHYDLQYIIGEDF